MDAATIIHPVVDEVAPGSNAPLIAGTLPGKLPTPEVNPAVAATAIPVQIVVMILGIIAFFYFARPVILPVFLACVAGMTLKPLIRWLSYCHIPPAISAAAVIFLLIAAVAIGFIQLGQPALAWMKEAHNT